MERVWLDGMVFSNDAMAAGGVVSGRVIRSDAYRWRVATRCPTASMSTQDQRVFETSSKRRESWDGRKMTWQCIPNFWCNGRKRSIGCHRGIAQRNTY